MTIDLRTMEEVTAIYESLSREAPIVLYRPNNKQNIFHRSKAITRAILGGNQSGKTHSAIAEDVAISAGFRPWLQPDDPDYIVRLGTGLPIPVPNVNKITMTDYDVLKETILPKFTDLAPAGMFEIRKNTRGEPTRIEWAWGSLTHFISQKKDPQSAASGTYHAAHHDEPPPRKFRIEILRGLIRYAGLESFSMTPAYGDWFERELIELSTQTETIQIFHMDTEDNAVENGGVLSREGIDQFKMTLTPMERKMRMHGLTAGTLYRIISNYEDREPWTVTDFDVPKDWIRFCIADPHEEKPDCILWVAFEPNGMSAVVYDEVMDWTTKGAFKQTAETIRSHEMLSGGAAMRRLIDPRRAAKIEKVTGNTVQREFELLGLYFEKAPGLRLEEGYKQTNEWFALDEETGLPFLTVMNHCAGIRTGLQMMKWKQDDNFEAKKTPVGPDDHVSCLRYLRTWGPNIRQLREAARNPDPRVMENLPSLEDLDVAYVDGVDTGY